MSTEKIKEKSVKKKKKNYDSFDIFINKILKQVHPDTGITSKASDFLNNLIHAYISKIMKAANLLLLKAKQKTLNNRVIGTAVRIQLPGELKTHAVSEATKAVTKYNARTIVKKSERKKGEPKGTSYAAGLQLSVPRISKIMRQVSFADNLGKPAAIYMTAVIEYLLAEILELAGNAARDNNKSRISSKFIFMAIVHDEELSKLSCGILMGGGVIPNTVQQIVPSKPEKPKKKKTKKNQGKKKIKKTKEGSSPEI
jgi:histone H2A